jgi:hypothetical protein
MFNLYNWHKTDKPSFVGHVHGIQTKDFTGASDIFSHGNGALVEVEVQMSRLGDFDQSTGETTPGEVP